MNTYLTEIEVKGKKYADVQIVADNQEEAQKTATFLNKKLKVVGKLIKDVKNN